MLDDTPQRKSCSKQAIIYWIRHVLAHLDSSIILVKMKWDLKIKNLQSGVHFPKSPLSANGSSQYLFRGWFYYFLFLACGINIVLDQNDKYDVDNLIVALWELYQGKKSIRWTKTEEEKSKEHKSSGRSKLKNDKNLLINSEPHYLCDGACVSPWN